MTRILFDSSGLSRLSVAASAQIPRKLPVDPLSRIDQYKNEKSDDHKFENDNNRRQSSAWSPEIISVAELTLSESSPYRQRLIESYLKARNYGSLAQYRLADAIKIVFDRNPLATAAGGLENAGLQYFVLRALQIDDGRRRNEAMHSLFQTMESGLSRRKLCELLQRFKFDAELSVSSEMIRTLEQEIRSGRYPCSDSYDPQDIKKVLRYAERHPMGRLILQRLKNTLSVEDLPGVLGDISAEPGELETSELIDQLSQDGYSLEEMAEWIYGTRHTAYCRDFKTAREIVVIMQEVQRYLDNSESLETAKLRFDRVFWSIAELPKIGVNEIMRLALVNPTEQVKRVCEEWKKGRLEIIMNDTLFMEMFTRFGKVTEETTCLFDQRRPKDLDRFIMRDIQPLRSSRLASRQEIRQFYAKLQNLASAIPHDGTHLEQSYEGINFSKMNFRERVESEIPADFNMYLWLVKNGDNDFAETARLLGETIAQYISHRARQNYSPKRKATVTPDSSQG